MTAGNGGRTREKTIHPNSGSDERKAAASALFDAGRMAEAESICRDVLAVETGDRHVMRLLSRILDAQGRLSEAVNILRKLTELQPADADTHYDLGRMLLAWEEQEIAAGDVFEPYALAFPWGDFPFPSRDHFPARKSSEAVAALRRAVDAPTSHAKARALLGLMLVQDLATVRDGADLVQATVRETPEDFRGHLAMAILGLRQGDWTLTSAASTRARDLQPDDGRALALQIFSAAAMTDDMIGADIFDELGAGTLVYLADCLARAQEDGAFTAAAWKALGPAISGITGRLLDEAETALLETQAFVHGAKCLDHARRLNRESFAASRVAGILLFQCSAFSMAEAALSYARDGNPEDVLARKYLALTQLVRDPDAFGATAREALDGADFLQLADMFAAQLDFENAEKFCRLAVEIAPEGLSAALKLAQLMGLQGDYDGAGSFLEKTRADHPDATELHGDLANAYLSEGRLEDAWPLYESRLLRRRGSTPRPPPPLSRWQGEALHGRKLLIWREEGIGDEIRFSSCLPDAIVQLDASITYECDPRLVSLYTRSFPGISVRPEDRENELTSDFDFHLPAGSLPMHFRKILEDFPAQGKFLNADRRRVERWRARLDALPPGPKIGIGWRSLNSGWHKLPLHSNLGDWRPIADVEGLQLISLQSRLQEGEIEAAAENFGMVVHRMAGLDIDNDMEEVAALMSALDAIVSCQCWLLHLGGAVGAKVYSFNGLPNPYTMGLDYNPWAPQTEVFYKRYGDDWTGPMTRITERLSQQFAVRT